MAALEDVEQCATEGLAQLEESHKALLHALRGLEECERLLPRLRSKSDVAPLVAMLRASIRLGIEAMGLHGAQYCRFADRKIRLLETMATPLPSRGTN